MPCAQLKVQRSWFKAESVDRGRRFVSAQFQGSDEAVPATAIFNFQLSAFNR
jgi:hypothetical protein